MRPSPPFLARRSRTLLALLLLASCGGGEDGSPGAPPAAPDEPSPPPSHWFVEVAAESGLDFVHQAYAERLFWIPEIMSGSVAVIDADGDGALDVYCVQGGTLVPPGGGEEGNRLYRNRGDGTFVDVTREAGVGDTGYGTGVLVGDVDGDGDSDLYVLNLRDNVLYLNDGAGHFEDVTERAGAAGGGYEAGGVLCDIDLDGDLDVYLANYVSWSPEVEPGCPGLGGALTYCAPLSYGLPPSDVLLINEGGGTFVDRSEESGISALRGRGLAAASADLDGDGLPDIYVANDGQPNFLLLGDGQGGFQEDSLLRGCAVNELGRPEASMGLQVLDLENDGDWDLFMTHLHLQTNTFFQARGGNFADRTVSTGLAGPSSGFTGFGLGFADYDQDGNLDLLVANGRILELESHPSETDAYAEPNHLYRGLGSGRFEHLGAPIADEVLGTSRGLALGDLDGDGDVDVLYQDNHAPLCYLRNQVGHRASWIGFHVLDAEGRVALGAAVEIEHEGRLQRRLCTGCYSYSAASETRVHFGLGSHEGEVGVRVIWADAEREEFPALAGDRVHELRRGRGVQEAR